MTTEKVLDRLSKLKAMQEGEAALGNMQAAESFAGMINARQGQKADHCIGAGRLRSSGAEWSDTAPNEKRIRHGNQQVQTWLVCVRL